MPAENVIIKALWKAIGDTEKTSARLSARNAGEYQYAVSALVDGKWTKLLPDDVVTVTVD